MKLEVICIPDDFRDDKEFCFCRGKNNKCQSTIFPKTSYSHGVCHCNQQARKEMRENKRRKLKDRRVIRP